MGVVRPSAGLLTPMRCRSSIRAAVAVTLAASVALLGGSAPAGAAAPGWSIVPIPQGGNIENGLLSAQCVSATYCVAVGSDTAGTSVPPFTEGDTLIETWDGESWSITPSPDVGGSGSVDVLDGVSCVTATDCLAVGYDSAGGPGAVRATLIETFDGTSWSIVASPDVGGSSHSDALNGVACLSVTDCLAVGDDDNGTTEVPLVESYNGTSWSVSSSAETGPGYLTAISCTSAPYCVAIGLASGSGAAETFDGTAWTASSSGPPNGATADVSCVSATDCTAVGVDSGNHGGGAFSLWNGTTWSDEPVVKPHDDFHSVTCVTATDCVAVGDYEIKPKQEVPPTRSLVALFNGKRWTLVTKNISPKGNRWDSLDAVACVSAADCLAVGGSDANGALATTGPS